MSTLTTIAALVGEIGVLIGVITPIIVSMRKISDGTRCQLRSEMLRIYYHNREREVIRQYEKGITITELELKMLIEASVGEFNKVFASTPAITESEDAV